MQCANPFNRLFPCKHQIHKPLIREFLLKMEDSISIPSQQINIWRTNQPINFFVFQAKIAPALNKNIQRAIPI